MPSTQMTLLCKAKFSFPEPSLTPEMFQVLLMTKQPSLTLSRRNGMWPKAYIHLTLKFYTVICYGHNLPHISPAPGSSLVQFPCQSPISVPQPDVQ